MSRSTYFSMMLLSASLSIPCAYAASQSETQCQQNIERFVVLNHAKQKTEIDQINTLGMSVADIETSTQTQGACHTWQLLVKSMKQQHADVLDAAERMTGQPAPVR